LKVKRMMEERLKVERMMEKRMKVKRMVSPPPPALGGRHTGRTRHAAAAPAAARTDACW
jgi:hypothetical protein